MISIRMLMNLRSYPLHQTDNEGEYLHSDEPSSLGYILDTFDGEVCHNTNLLSYEDALRYGMTV